MNNTRFATILVSVLFCTGNNTLTYGFQEANVPSSEQQEKNGHLDIQDLEKLEAMFERNDDRDVERYYQNLFNEADIDELIAMKLHRNTSVAVQAAWEIARLDDTTDHTSCFNRDSFVGFLEASFQTNSPNWWREYMRETGTAEGWKRTLPTLQLTHAGNVLCALETSVVDSSADGIVLRYRDKTAVLPGHVFERDEDQQLIGRIAVEFSNDKCFFTVYGDWADRHPVICINTQTGDLLWQTDCVGAFPNLARTGLSTSYVELKLGPSGNLYVFGAATVGGYVQVFDQTDGTNLGKFSTRYQHRP